MKNRVRRLGGDEAAVQIAEYRVGAAVQAGTEVLGCGEASLFACSGDGGEDLIHVVRSSQGIK